MATQEDKILLELLERATKTGVFPGAVALVAQEGKVVFFEHVGHRLLVPERVPMARDTIFDIASLTKVLATTPAIMKLVDEEKLNLDQPLAELLSKAALGDKRDLTPRLLLTHSAGLVDWKPFYEKLRDHPLKDRKKVLREWVIDEPFAYEPGKGSLYSDLGFMLLEWVIEEKTGETLPGFVEKHFYGPLRLKRTFLRGGEGRLLLGVAKEEFAATEDCPWRKRVLQGEVHDDNAWTLGGYSGHAGLFSTAEEIYVIANMLREHYLGQAERLLQAGDGEGVLQKTGHCQGKRLGARVGHKGTGRKQRRKVFFKGQRGAYRVHGNIHMDGSRKRCDCHTAHESCPSEKRQ